MVIPIGDTATTRIVPVVNYALIALNTILFLLQQVLPERFTVAYAATPYEITHNIDLDRSAMIEVRNPDDPLAQPVRESLADAKVDQAKIPLPIWLTVLTAMFLHGSPMHLAGNMLYLWIFGDNVEEVLGRIGYLAIYLTCGLVGSLAQVAATPDSLIPILGASGAIAGVMGAYVVWFPFNRVRVLVFPYVLEMPALIVIGGWILLQLFVSDTTPAYSAQRGGVAYLAHLGGAATGALFALVVRNGPRVLAQREEWTQEPV